MQVSRHIIEVNREPHILGLCFDITERKQAEAELLQTLDREKELGRLRCIFVSMLSHEFRTPLGIIQGGKKVYWRFTNGIDDIFNLFRTRNFNRSGMGCRRKSMQAQHPESEKSGPLQILAPVDGYVLNVYEESAGVVTPSLPIMEVGYPQDLEAEIELLSSDAVGVAPGADVSIEHWGGDSPLRGRVSVVEPGAFTKVSALGVEEQRVKVRVDFLDSAPSGLGDRYRVEARIVTWRGHNVLQVPTGALFRRGNDWMTFAARQGKAQLRKVEITHNNGVAAEVCSGLSEGDAVIIHPPDTVHDGVSILAYP
jgi:hypothetical protein